MAEYAVGDDPSNFAINNLQIEAFDFLDAVKALVFHKEIKGDRPNIPDYNRRLITNDVKILAQPGTKKIDAIISKDANSLKQYVQPLINANLLQVKLFDLNISLQKVLGKLF